MKYITNIICLIMLSVSISFSQESQKTDSLKYKSDIKILFTFKNFDAENNQLFINENNDVMILLKNNQLMAISTKSDKKVSISLPKDIHKAEKIIYSDEYLIVKDGCFIKQLKDSTINIYMKMPDENFSIYPAGLSKIYILLKNKKKYELFFVDMKTNTQIKILSHSKKITDILGDGERTFVAIDKDIYLLENKESILIHHNETPINSITGSDYGLFFASESGLSYLSMPFIVVPMDVGYVQKVICKNNILYFLKKDGKLFMIENANSFENKIRDFFND